MRISPTLRLPDTSRHATSFRDAELGIPYALLTMTIAYQ